MQPEIVRERTKARLQRRPIIWNNDGSDIQSIAYAGGKWPIPLESVEQFWDGTLRFLEGTSVETILYCARTNEPDWEFPTKYIEVLGPNPVQHVVDFARKHQKEFFLFHPHERCALLALRSESRILVLPQAGPSRTPAWLYLTYPLGGNGRPLAESIHAHRGAALENEAV
ncbi:MAG: hypothetical protein OXT71_09490 [Acidobacteriota bacterium]|nr:hypothetical protein [Acidobacteriota bacterium]MDE2926618.1 hypothetical protein [Acidobacteriota bacterium]